LTICLHSSLHFFCRPQAPPPLHSFPTRRSSDLVHRHGTAEAHAEAARHLLLEAELRGDAVRQAELAHAAEHRRRTAREDLDAFRSEEHTSELQSRENLVCRLLLEKKKSVPLQKV